MRLEVEVEVLLVLGEGSVTRERKEFVCGDASDGDKAIRWELGRIQVIVKLIDCFRRDLFPLRGQALFTCCHLLPLLLGNSCHRVVADPECARNCTLGIAVGECAYDSLPNGERAELCVVTLWHKATRR